MTATNRNLVLTGFMGTGKTTIGKLVAQQLGWSFIDTDDSIEELAGKSIPEIFETDGEPAFRKLESQVLDQVAQAQRLVIATGGGALVNRDNLELVERDSLVVCLDASARTIAKRLDGDRSRPLLQEANPIERIRTLLADRESAYRRIAWHIDTSCKDDTQVACQVLKLMNMQPSAYTVDSPTGDYAIAICDHAIQWLPDLLKAHCSNGQLMIVTDENVWHSHGNRIKQALDDSEIPYHKIILPAGEEHKNLNTLEQLYDSFVKAGLDRSSTIVAIGGGVITDMAGFAASTYMRGIGLVQVPTTLLGMIDASVGGKVAVDLPSGKNLVGAFTSPRLVVIDPIFASTLANEQKKCGLAEIIKAGIIADPELFESLENTDPDVRWSIEHALQVKIDIVRDDPQEHGRRAVLNLGHTFGHAFEVLSNYRLPHGLAVGMGIAAATRTAEAMAVCSANTRERIEATLLRHGLEIRWQAKSIDAVLEAMRSDKKNRNGIMHLVLPHDVGQVKVHAIHDMAPLREGLVRSRG